MRWHKLLFITLFFFLCFSKVYAYQVYNFDEYVFYDPVNNNECTYKNYWTIYNQDTTCYRFITITKDDTSDKDTLKVILDHNVAISKYSDYEAVLVNTMGKWIRYNGEYDILDEDTAYDIMSLTERPTIELLR